MAHRSDRATSLAERSDLLPSQNELDLRKIALIS